ncbi:MAG: hypothetical protein K6A69_06260 [Lachnospiraceae bacterium]|nr:hypothetical protein [Lachnospiraceae bacterium]
MKYSDKIIYMEGIITEVHDGAVAIDLKGRLGSMRIPLRMLITDTEPKVGQEVGFNMSFIEQLPQAPNGTYVK